MGLELNSIEKEIVPNTSNDNVTVLGRKINQQNWNILISYVGQTVFSLPFIYINGDSVDLLLDGTYKRNGLDYSIEGSSLTWLSGVTLDIDSQLIIWG